MLRDWRVSSLVSIVERSLKTTTFNRDAFCLYYDASKKTVQALNGSGRSPRALSIDVARKNGATGRGLLATDLNSVTVPGAAAAWYDTVARFGNKKVCMPS